MIQCIGQKERGRRCTNESETPNDTRWPDVFLCPTCANQPARKGSTNSNGIVQERPTKVNYIVNFHK